MIHADEEKLVLDAMALGHYSIFLLSVYSVERKEMLEVSAIKHPTIKGKVVNK